MKTKSAELTVECIIDGEQDKVIIDKVRERLEFYAEEDFNTFLSNVSVPLYTNHVVQKHGARLLIKNRQDTSKLIAVVMEKDTEPDATKTRRWTRPELRRVKRCYPYPKRWAHLWRANRRSWKENEEKAREILNLT